MANYRVWVHLKKSGDDRFYSARSKAKAIAICKAARKSKRYSMVESPVVVKMDRELKMKSRRKR